MYQITGGGYGGNVAHDGLSNGCSTIGISKTAPVEVMEQYYPVLFRRFALREGSGGAGAHRGGFGVHYEVELLRGEARASFVMDHGASGRRGCSAGATARRTSCASTATGRRSSRPTCRRTRTSPSKPATGRGDDAGRRRLRCPATRDPALVARDRRRGYYRGTNPTRCGGADHERRQPLDGSPLQEIRRAGGRRHRAVRCLPCPVPHPARPLRRLLALRQRGRPPGPHRSGRAAARRGGSGQKLVPFGRRNGTGGCSIPRAPSSPASAPAPPIRTTSPRPSSWRASTKGSRPSRS